MTRSHTLSTPRGKDLTAVASTSVSSHTDGWLFARKTVTALDVVYALKRSGRTLYGFGA